MPPDSASPRPTQRSSSRRSHTAEEESWSQERRNLRAPREPHSPATEIGKGRRAGGRAGRQAERRK